MKPLGIQAFGLTCALGDDPDRIASAMRAASTAGMVPAPLLGGELLPVGRAPEPPPMPEAFARFDCRNHRLALAAFLQIQPAVLAARAHFGASRVAVVIGTSTSGMDACESQFFASPDPALPTPSTLAPTSAYDYVHQQEFGSCASFLATFAELSGPAYTLSTACSSSAKAFASAAQLLEAGLCDAVLCGGADTLCRLTRNGFESLSTLDRGICNPLGRSRCGLNIGEGAALFLLTREPAPLCLLGHGESNDAYHSSTPDPEGRGAEAAMRAALHSAGLSAEAIAYINLHGTATPHNDQMETRAIARIFTEVPVSSTKPLTGHCLGAAGAVEAALCLLALGQSPGGSSEWFPPPHLWRGDTDPQLPSLPLVSLPPQPLRKRVCLSNSFAFGGSNCALVLGQPAHSQSSDGVQP